MLFPVVTLLFGAKEPTKQLNILWLKKGGLFYVEFIIIWGSDHIQPTELKYFHTKQNIKLDFVLQEMFKTIGIGRGSLSWLLFHILFSF